MNILFICLGNICRSPAAEGILKALLKQRGIADWHVDSAGIGGWHVGDLPDPRMREAASARGITLTHRCRQVRPCDFDHFDMVIGMDTDNLRDLRRIAPTKVAQSKIHSIAEWLPAGYDHVPDPYYGNRSGFNHALDLLEYACDKLISEEAI